MHFLTQFLHSSDVINICTTYHASKFMAHKRKTISSNFLFKILFYILYSENSRLLSVVQAIKKFQALLMSRQFLWIDAGTKVNGNTLIDFKRLKWNQEESAFSSKIPISKLFFRKNKIKSISTSPPKVFLEDLEILEKEHYQRLQQRNLNDILARCKFITAKSRRKSLKGKILSSLRFPEICMYTQNLGMCSFLVLRSLYSLKCLRIKLKINVENRWRPSSSFHSACFYKK